MKLLIELEEEYVKAIDKIRFLVGGRTDRKLQLEIIKAIKNGIALEQEPRKGHWIPHPNAIYAHLICDKCLSRAPYDCKTNFCPICGADMREVEE